MNRSQLIAAFAVLLCVTGGSFGQQVLHPPSRSCTGTGGSATSRGIVNQYPAGGYMMVLAKIPAGLQGSLEFYLCPEASKEECLRKIPMQLADGSGTKYDLSKVPKSDKYEVPVILPDDVTCDACSVQMRTVVTDCGDNKDCITLDQTSCFDISIRKPKEEEKRLFGLLFGAARMIGRGVGAIVRHVKRRRG